MNTYDEGESVTLEATITDQKTGNRIDAQHLVFTWGVEPVVPGGARVPTGSFSLDSQTISHDSAGAYHVVVPTAGVVPTTRHEVIVSWEWIATGGVVGAKQGKFRVVALPW